MMIKVKKTTAYTFLVILGFLVNVLYAQENNSNKLFKEELTLKSAIDYALNNKAEAIKAKLDVENAEYEIQEVRANLLPQLSGTGGLTYNPLLQKSALPGEILGQPGTTIFAEFGQKWNGSIGAQLTQNLFNQSIFTGLKAAKSSREFYRINQQLTNDEVIEKVATNYYQVYIEQAKLNVIDSSFQNTQKVRQVLQGKYENGLAKKIDIDRLDVELSNIQTKKQEALNALTLQKNTLKFLMGYPIHYEIQLPEPNFQITKMISENEDIDVENINEYKLLTTQEALLNYQKNAIQAEYYPSLSFSANYNYQGLGNDFPIFGGSGSDANWFEVASVGLNLKIPIFNGFLTRSKVRQANIDIEAVKTDLKDTQLAIELNFRNAINEIAVSLINIQNQESNVALSRSVLEDVSNNYYNGLATLTDLLDAQNSFIESKNNLNQSQLNYKIAELQLLKAKGELNTLLN